MIEDKTRILQKNVWAYMYVYASYTRAQQSFSSTEIQSAHFADLGD